MCSMSSSWDPPSGKRWELHRHLRMKKVSLMSPASGPNYQRHSWCRFVPAIPKRITIQSGSWSSDPHVASHEEKMPGWSAKFGKGQGSSDAIFSSIASLNSDSLIPSPILSITIFSRSRMLGHPWICIGPMPLNGRRLLVADTGHVHYHRIRFLGAISDDHQGLGLGATSW